MHGYFKKKLQQDDNIDIKASQLRCRTKQMTSDFETDSCQQPTMNNKCRLCKYSVEDVNHVISSCPNMSARYYLPLRLDALAKYVLKTVIMKNHSGMKYRELTKYEYVIKHANAEYWWNISIKTATKVPHNKPDIVRWNKLNKECSILEFGYRADVNISNKANEKNNVYGMLIRNMQILYPDYKFNMIPIIVGVLEYIPK